MGRDNNHFRREFETGVLDVFRRGNGDWDWSYGGVSLPNWPQTAGRANRLLEALGAKPSELTTI